MFDALASCSVPVWMLFFFCRWVSVYLLGTEDGVVSQEKFVSFSKIWYVEAFFTILHHIFMSSYIIWSVTVVVVTSHRWNIFQIHFHPTTVNKVNCKLQLLISSIGAPNFAVRWVANLLHSREVKGLRLVPDVGYPIWGFLSHSWDPQTNITIVPRILGQNCFLTRPFRFIMS
jgi:hypothetical protein